MQAGGPSARGVTRSRERRPVFGRCPANSKLLGTHGRVNWPLLRRPSPLSYPLKSVPLGEPAAAPGRPCM